MQATYNVKDPIEILFGQMETGQEFAIVGNLPSSESAAGRHGGHQDPRNTRIQTCIFHVEEHRR